MQNSVTVMGNLTAEPELRFSQAGNPWARFSIAENVRVRDASGEWVDGDANYYDVKAFGAIAEKVAEFAAKGTRLIVVGKITQERWETPEGDKRSKVSVVASDVGESFRWREASTGKPKAQGGGGYNPRNAADQAADLAASNQEPF